jgi:hypothetical protein
VARRVAGAQDDGRHGGRRAVRRPQPTDAQAAGVAEASGDAQATGVALRGDAAMRHDGRWPLARRPRGLRGGRLDLVIL